MMYIVQYFSEKGIDKWKTACYNNQAVSEKRSSNHNSGSPSGLKKKVEKLQKTFEKPLDKQKEMWYNTKVADNKQQQTQL